MSMKSRAALFAAMAGAALLNPGATIEDPFQGQSKPRIRRPDRSIKFSTPLTKKQLKARRLAKIGRQTRKRNRRK